MARVRANGKAVQDGSKITIPRIGVWHADLIVDTPTAITGKVTISIGDGKFVLEGTADAGATGSFVDTARVSVVGGAGGLGKIAQMKHYGNDPTVGVVLGDLLTTAGETLSPTADQGILKTSLEAWTTMALPIGRIIARLMSVAVADGAWRVLPDGTIWVGRETWPDSGLREPNDYQIESQNDEQQLAVIAVEAPTLRPGFEIGGRRVSYVEYELGPRVLMKTWFGEGEHDEFKAAISSMVKGVLPDIEYRVWYEAKVDHQEGDLVDVDPGNGIVPTMAKVPVRCGPGMSITGLKGGTVLVGWAGGDPSKPRAFAFSPDGSSGTAVWNMDKIFLAGSDGQPTTLGDVVKEINDRIERHIHPCTGGTVSPSPDLAGLPDPRAEHVWVK